MAAQILDITGSGNGLLPIWQQAITWTNVDFLRQEQITVKFGSKYEHGLTNICKMFAILCQP